MSKNNPHRKGNLIKKNVRKQKPVITKQNGKIAILCPFCPNPHPISPDQQSPCGTHLELNAVQLTYRNVECVLCGDKKGVLVRAGDKFVHAHKCSPGKVYYPTPPKKSRLAAILFGFPQFTHLWLGRVFGKVPIRLQDDKGEVAGYTWQPIKLRKVTHAENQRPVS